MDASWKDLWQQDEDANPVNPTGNPTFESIVAARLSRRELLKGAAVAWRRRTPGACAGRMGPAPRRPAGSFPSAPPATTRWSCRQATPTMS